MPQFFLFCQSLASVLPKHFNLPLMFRFVGVKELDIVCLKITGTVLLIILL